MVEKTVDWLDSSGFRFPITSSPHFCIILAYGLLYVSSTMIVQLTILFGTSCGSLHGHDRLDCAALRQVIVGPGVAGRRGIPKGTEELSVRIIACRKNPFLELRSATKAKGLQYVKPYGRSRNDSGCIVHYAWLNFTGRHGTSMRVQGCTVPTLAS